MNRKLYILPILLLLALVGCKGDDLPTPKPVDDGALSFNTTAGERTTRAESATETGPLLHDMGYQTFGIWTWRTSEVLPTTDWKTVMEHYHVSYDPKYTDQGRGENGWGYDKEGAFANQVLKYWNFSSTYYEFEGYSPWVGGTAGTKPYVSMDGSRKLVFHNVAGHLPARDAVTEYSDVNKDKVDWLYTYCRRTMSGTPYRIDCDLTISDDEKWFIGYDDKTVTKCVPLRFHHLLPKVIFRLHVYDGRTGHENDEIAQYLDISVKPHDDTVDNSKDTPIFTSGEDVAFTPTGTSPDLVYVSGTPTGFNEFAEKSPSPGVDWTASVFRTFSKAADTDYQDITPIKNDGSGRGWLELPQKAPTFDVNLNFGGTGYTRTLDPAVNTALPQVWEPDHIYVYVIHFNTAAPVLEVTSYVEEWSSEDDEFSLTDW